MLHVRTRQTLAVVVAIAVMCSFVGAPVAGAAALDTDTSSGLDELDGDTQTSADTPDDGDDSTNDSDDGSSDDNSSDDDSDDGSTTDDDSTNDSTNDTGDGSGDDDASTDDNSSDDRTLQRDDSDGDDADDERPPLSLEELVNVTEEDLENATDGVEGPSTSTITSGEETVNGTVDRILTYAELETALGLDPLGAGPLEGGAETAGQTYTYDHSTRTDPGEPPARGHVGAVTDPATASGGDGDAAAGGDDGSEPANPVGGATIGFGAVATAAALRGSPVVSGSRAARSGGLLSRLLEKVRPFVLPLRYSRYDDSDPLEHDARERVYEIVNETPGSYLSEVSQEADLPLSTTRHHIKILEREDLVSGAKIHGKRRFYPAYAEGIELAAALNDDSTASIIKAIAHVGAASVSDLADELGRDPSTISHHLQRLEEDGVITRERDGRAVVNKLSPEARTALEPETAAGAAERGEAIAGGAD